MVILIVNDGKGLMEEALVIIFSYNTQQYAPILSQQATEEE